MRVLIVTVGSWGDVAPYTGLGQRLAGAGHTVALATHARFEAAVTACGLGFRPLPVDPRDELASPDGQGLARAAGPAMEMARMARLARTFMPRLAQGIADAVRAAPVDALLAATLAEPVCHVLGDALDLPVVGAYLQPVTPTAGHPPLVASTRSLGAPANRLAGHLLRAAAEPLFAPAVAALRRELGLPRRVLSGPLALPRARTVVHGFSPRVVPRPADWPAGHRAEGYWWPAGPGPDWRPDPRLADFLDAGPPPVFLGFGSFVTTDAERLSRLLARACRLARVRGVIQAGWSGLHAEGPDLLTVAEVPHSWLFPRTAAVVHHAGAGTTAAGLRAGVPAVPVPVQLDQHFWAARLTALGAAPRPVPYRRLTAEALAAALRAAVTEPGHRARARSLAAALAGEDGARPVLAAVDRLARGRPG
ncbi:glycosyltransferase [Streptomyces antimicrobicus]|uniref:Glycosyltransferase n=1 Tax=Streptomyces antimicrobicus TaxID=2883108 RepID=A0ABS8BD90_9ACTN|nr:glycosyltransferase [Streptomyces antimicrobicus]MCB5182580.1 glycosyltransferase [Streptomyces antimicrobicus]